MIMTMRSKVLCKIIVWKEAAAHLSKSCSSAKNWQMLKMEVMDVFTLGDGDEYIWNKIKALLQINELSMRPVAILWWSPYFGADDDDDYDTS